MKKIASNFKTKAKELLSGIFVIGVINLILTGGLLLLFNFSATTLVVLNAIVFILGCVLLLKTTDLI